MIGFAREPERTSREVRQIDVGKNEYVAVRRSRFVQLGIQSDDLLLLGFAIFSALCFIVGYTWR